MPRTDPGERAAEAIVQRLRTTQSLEVESSDSYPAIQQELRAVFDQAEWTEQEADELRGALVEALESSSHVEELFVDDVMLGRYLSAALLDYFAVVGKHRGPGGSRRNPPRGESHAPAEPSAPVVSTEPLAQRGFVFPLFEGTELDADGPGPCSVTKEHAELRFEGASYASLRAGKSFVTHDTELGRVGQLEAGLGLTGGVPSDSAVDARGTEAVTEDGVTRYRVDGALLQELIRTPQYRTAQGESWLFCCGAPMVFLGRSAVDDVTPDDLPEMIAPHTVADVDEFLENVLDDKQALYVFRCNTCQKRRAHTER